MIDLCRHRAAAAALLLLAAAGCGNPSLNPADTNGVATDPQQQFLAALASHCGEAFRGRLVLEPEGDPMLSGSETLLAHFRDCSEDEVRIPFHIEMEGTGQWDSSRTWYLMRSASGLELRHDHRAYDGSEDARTWYGGITLGPGTSVQQDFASPERTAAAGLPVGWRIEILPGERYRYGTTYDGSYDWMIEFDLSEPHADEIPAAWGHEAAPSRIPGPP